MTAFVLALVLDTLWGDPPNQYHPVAVMGAYIRWMSAHAPARGPVRQFLYGMFLIFLGTALFSLPLVVLGRLVSPFPWLAVVVHAILLKAIFSLRRLLTVGREVEQALEKGDVSGAQAVVRFHLVSRGTNRLGAGHVSSATIESLAENFSDSFVAPLLAFVIGGLPLAWAYRFVNTADAMIGYRDQKYEYLGKCVARLDDVFNWIPSRLSGLLIVLAAPFVGGNIRAAWRVMVAQNGRTASPNAGWPMTAAAGALGVTLEKIAHYRLEGGTHLPQAVCIRQARQLVGMAAVIGSILLPLIMLGIRHA